MAIDFRTFNSIINPILSAKYPVLIRGRHGIGKSELVYQTAKDLGLPVVERRASQMTEGDLLGLPKVEKGVTKWLAPEWLHTACTKPVVLFLDEVDRATMEVRQGIFELCDSRKIAGQVLHPDTLIFAAVNGGEHGDQYQVGEMDPAELDRWTVFDVEPSTEDWLTWAKDKVDGILWDFINQNRNHLEHTGDFEPNKVYPSRRSWVRLNDCFAQANLLVEDADTSVMFPLATGFVGFEAAVSFKDLVDNYERQVTIENILDEGKIQLTERFGINDHNALVEKMEAKEIFTAPLSEERVENLARYFMVVPSEVGMKLWTVLGQGDNANVIAFHGTIVDGKSISNNLVELMTGKNVDDEE